MVAGVISSLSGDGEDPNAYTERKFVEVEQGGVDRLMKQLSPKLDLSVSDEISGNEEANIAVELQFETMDDFDPMGVATQIPQTAKLLEIRQQLADLYGKVEANDKLAGILGDVLGNADKQAQLRSELGIDSGSDE